MQSISAPVAAFKQREAAERQEKPTKPEAQKSSPLGSPNPQVSFIAPTPLTTLEPIDEQPQDVSTESSRIAHADKEKNHLISDAPFSSSPKSENMALSPVTEPSLRQPAVEFAMSTTISPRVANYHPMLSLRGVLHQLFSQWALY